MKYKKYKLLIQNTICKLNIETKINKNLIMMVFNFDCQDYIHKIQTKVCILIVFNFMIANIMIFIYIMNHYI